MSDAIPITVCVIALTQSDYKDLDPDLQTKLTSLKEHYDFSVAGKPYAASPDEWRPFDTNSPIRDYLAKANLEPSLLSSQLYDSRTLGDVLKNTYLYLIDPLVLLHTKKGSRLSGEIQLAIYTSEKAFCVILPDGLPSTLREEIEAICFEKLNDLRKAWNDQDYCEYVETADRLRKYLKRLARQISEKPNPSALAAFQALYHQLGVANPDLYKSPKLS